MKSVNSVNRYILYIVALVVLASCAPGTPDQYIQPDELEDILYDLHLAQGMVYQGEDYKQYDYNRMLYHAAVLKKHGITQAELDSSMVYYYKRADRLDDIYKRVAKRLSEAALDLGATEGEVNQYSQVSTSGDTANIWKGDVAAVLLPYPMHNRLEFDVKADSASREGDMYVLNMMLDFFFQNGMKEAEGCLMLIYENDSIACRTSRLSFNGQNQLRLQASDDHRVKQVKGYVYLSRGNDDASTLRILFIRDIQLIRMHKHEFKKAEPVDSMKTDTLARPASIDVSTDSMSAPADSQSRFGRVLPAGGRGVREKDVVPRRDIKLKTE